MTDSIYNSNKEIKDSALVLLKELYSHCDDDAVTFVRNLKNLRPVQAKEVKDMLQETEKTSKSQQVRIFQGSSNNLPVQESNSPKQRNK